MNFYLQRVDAYQSYVQECYSTRMDASGDDEPLDAPISIALKAVTNGDPDTKEFALKDFWVAAISNEASHSFHISSARPS